MSRVAFNFDTIVIFKKANEKRKEEIALLTKRHNITYATGYVKYLVKMIRSEASINDIKKFVDIIPHDLNYSEIDYLEIYEMIKRSIE